jgi:hypothetical protein
MNFQRASCLLATSFRPRAFPPQLQAMTGILVSNLTLTIYFNFIGFACLRPSVNILFDQKKPQ